MAYTTKKTRRVLVLVALASGTLAMSCSMNSQKVVPADREAINREMPLVAEYDTKRDEVKRAVNMLAMKGLLDSQSGKELKESLDIEYVYYEASIVSLARGEMDDYRSYVALAQKELDRAKSTVMARVQNLHQKDLQQ
jgi:predicted transcriptional regulator